MSENNRKVTTEQTGMSDDSDSASHNAPAVIRFTATMDAPEKRRLADLPDRVVSGDPHHTSENRYQNGRLQAGTWTSTPGRWHVFSDRDEFCVILSGRVALVSASGVRQEFGAGDSFLIPDGFKGFWEVIETATKHFVILHSENP